MKKRTRLNKPYKIIVHDEDYDETVILSLFIIVINLIMTILMCGLKEYDSKRFARIGKGRRLLCRN